MSGRSYILPDDTSSANVQVSNFAVAHQSLRQSNCEGGGLELGVASRVVLESIHVGSFGS